MTLLIFLKPLITSRQHKVILGVSRKVCEIRVVQVHYEIFCALHLCIIKLAKIFLEPWSDLRKHKVTLGMGQCFFLWQKIAKFLFYEKGSYLYKRKKGVEGGGGS
jgi:hypothetical protein